MQARNRTARRWFRVKQSAEGDQRGSEKDAVRCPLYDREYPLEDHQAYKQTSNGVTVAANPVQIAPGAVLGHEDHDAGAAIQRRSWNEVEGTEEQIQTENNLQNQEAKTRFACEGVKGEEVVGKSDAQHQSGDDHKCEVGSGAGKGHPGGTVRMTAFPERIVRSTGPTDHAAGEKKAEDRDNDHAKGRPADMRDRIEGDLATEGSGGVSSEFGDEGMGRFVTSGGKKKRDVPDKAEYQCFGREIWHRELG